MPTLYLIFSHLIADFILQPKDLLLWKYKSWKGIATHVMVHFLISLAVLFPYLPSMKVVGILLLIVTTHFFIDLCKIKAESRSKKYLLLFLTDQACHFGIIVLSGIALVNEPAQWGGSLFLHFYQNPFIVTGLCLILLISFPLEILQYQIKRQKNHLEKFHPHYGTMLRRVFIFSFLYGLFLVFWIFEAMT